MILQKKHFSFYASSLNKIINLSLCLSKIERQKFQRFILWSLQISSGCGVPNLTKLGIMLKFIFGKSRMDYSVSVTSHRETKWQIWCSVPSHFKVFFMIIVGDNSCEKALFPLSSETDWLSEHFMMEPHPSQSLRVGKKIVQNHKLSCRIIHVYHTLFVMILCVWGEGKRPNVKRNNGKRSNLLYTSENKYTRGKKS